MALPNIDISPILDIAWDLLQWVMDWIWLLCLMVFMAVIVAGAGDMLKAILNPRRGEKSPISRTRE